MLKVTLAHEAPRGMLELKRDDHGDIDILLELSGGALVTLAYFCSGDGTLTLCHIPSERRNKVRELGFSLTEDGLLEVDA